MGYNSSILLLSLIEDILDLSKIDSGNFAMHITDFDLKDLIDEVYDIFIFQCENKGLELKVEIDPYLNSIVISSDKGRIKQVLLNLISNSLKFTFEGIIFIKIKYVFKEGKNFIQFSVSDTGIGIKEKDKNKLFKLFGMIKTHENQNKLNPNGWGIGLTVSKKYVEYLGGDINIILGFLNGRGTTVQFSIPLVRAKSDDISKNLVVSEDPFISLANTETLNRRVLNSARNRLETFRASL